MTNFNAKHVLIFLLFFCASFYNASADVIITKGTPTTPISNDLSSLHSSGGSFTTLENIEIADQGLGDFAIGDGQTFVLAAPAGWIFNTSAEIIVSTTGPDIISSEVTSITPTHITVTYTVEMGLGVDRNSMIISGIQVMSTTSSLGSANIIRSGGTGIIYGLVDNTVVAELTKVAGAPILLQVLLDGEINAPGTPTGKSGSYGAKNAGENFLLTVNAVDFGFNICSSVSDEVQLSSLNSYFKLPTDLTKNLAGGTVNFDVALTTASTSTSLYKTIVATNLNTPSVLAGTSGGITVNSGLYSNLLVVLPGETWAPGSTTGKTGTLTDRVSNEPFNVGVYATDEYWNVVDDNTNIIALSSNDPLSTDPANQTMSSTGFLEFEITLKTLGALYHLKAEDIAETSINYATQLINVVAGEFVSLQILLPGETAAPFTLTGKTGTPFSSGSLKAGEEFEVVVNAVDANWNVVGSITDAISLAHADPLFAASSEFPTSISLVNGTATIPVVLKRANDTHALVVTHLGTPTQSSLLTENFPVLVNDYVKLQIVLPGETEAPGTATGKTGSPTARVAGNLFIVTVNAVDAYWNLITTATDQVTISTTSANASSPDTYALLDGKRQNFRITLRELGITSLTANNISNVSIESGVSSDVEVVSGGFAKLQILLPGEVAAPGTELGKTGTPLPQVAGVPFTAQIRAVDAAWYLVTDVDDMLSFNSTDVIAALPSGLSFVDGIVNVDFTLRTASASTIITANNTTDGSKAPSSSGLVTVVAGAYTQLAALLPGQILTPSLTNGVVGNPNIPERGNTFSIKLRAIDQYFNPVIGATSTIEITGAPGNDFPLSVALLSAADQDVEVTINNAGIQTLVFTDNAALPIISTSVSIPEATDPSLITDYFRTLASGTWTDTGIWESSIDGVSGWHPATVFPNSSSNQILIEENHSVEVVDDLEVDQLIIKSGGELIVSANVFTVANASEEADILVEGVLRGTNYGTFGPSSGKIVVSASGKYTHDYTNVSGVVPTATWEEGSICEFVGYTSWAGLIQNTNQNFSTVVWNCPNQNNVIDGPALDASFDAQHVEVISSGTGIVFLGNAAGTSNITGDLAITNSRVGISRANNKILNLQGNLTLTSATLARGMGNATLNFNGTGSTQVVTKTGSVLANSINFVVKSAAVVDFGTSIIDGATGTFRVEDNATIVTADEGGFAATGTYEGAIQNSGARFYGVASYVYNGEAAQAAGNGLPAVVKDIIINNPTSVSLAAGTGNLTVNGRLAINTDGAYLDLGEHPLLGTYIQEGAGTLKTAATSNAFAADKDWNLGVEFKGNAAQTVVSGNYNRLLAFSGLGVKTMPAGILNVSGNWMSSGGPIDLVTNSTTINFNGNEDQSISDLGSNAGNGVEFQTVNFEGLGLKTFTSGPISIATNGILTMAAGATLNANGNLTILSGPLSSGRVAAMPSDASIIGYVNVQRFMKGGNVDPYRTYRMFSSPVHTDEVNKTYAFTQFIDDMPITGTAAAAGLFDINSVNRASAWTYEPTSLTNKYVEIPNINTSLKIGQGAYLFYRGDRSMLPSSIEGDAFPNITDGLVDFEGKLNQHNIAVPLVYEASVSGFNLIGNPYPSSISWSDVYSNNTDVLANAHTWVWNPAVRQYAVFDGNVGTNEASGIIPVGQGFFVQAKANANLIFTEDVKVDSQPSFSMMSAPLDEDNISLRSSGMGKLSTAKKGATGVTPSANVSVKLSKVGTPYTIEAVVVFDGGKSARFVQNEDVRYLKGSEVFLSTLSEDNIALSINYMPALAKEKEVKLAITDATVTSGSYALKLDYSHLPLGCIVSIKDNYLGKTTPIVSGESYNFEIQGATAATFGNSRFSLLLENPDVLPVEVTTFKAVKVEEGVSVTWTTEAAKNASRFVLERAGEDKVFSKLYTTPTRGTKASYTYIDRAPLFGYNYYRLTQVDRNDDESTTAPVAVNFDAQVTQGESLLVYPNPAVADVSLRAIGMLKNDKLTVRLSNMMGQEVFSEKVSSTALSNGITLNVGHLTPGVYVIETIDSASKVLRKVKLIKQ